MRHRDAWAEEATSPVAEEWARENPAPSPAPPVSEEPERGIELAEENLPRDVLIVVSKLKAYMRARSGMNTSDGVAAVLSDHLRKVCDGAIRNAAAAGRKTVMDRDFDFY